MYAYQYHSLSVSHVYACTQGHIHMMHAKEYLPKRFFRRILTVVVRIVCSCLLLSMLNYFSESFTHWKAVYAFVSTYMSACVCVCVCVCVDSTTRMKSSCLLRKTRKTCFLSSLVRHRVQMGMHRRGMLTHSHTHIYNCFIVNSITCFCLVLF